MKISITQVGSFCFAWGLGGIATLIAFWILDLGIDNPMYYKLFFDVFIMGLGLGILSCDLWFSCVRR